MKTQTTRTSALLKVGALLCGVLLAVGTAGAGQSGRCYTAEVTATIALPDGSLHDPGRLKFCVTRMHTPVEAMHHTSVDGEAIGLFRSRVGTSEGIDGAATAFFVFAKRGDGVLELEGFAHPGRDGRLITYQVDLARARVTTRWALLEEFATDERMILIAAR
jgi:hypothetical protein